MKRTAVIAALLLVAAACSPAADTDRTTTTPAADTTTTVPATTTTAVAAFPVTVEDDSGVVTIDDRPETIVSLSPTATEMLFAMGAGDQVVAVDDQSNYPEDAPMTDLSGFTPNLEAILSFEPDLVIISFDPADTPISTGLAEVGVPTLLLGPAVALDDVYRQIEVIGAATGNLEEAEQLSKEIQTGLDEIVAQSGGAGEGVTFYHEVDATLYSVTSATFIGQIYGLIGLENIADAADTAGAGYPQLSSEYVVAQDPDLIFLADASYGESAETLSQRPGWEGLTALQRGAVIPLDADIASRWGPRIVDFLQVVAAAVTEHAP